jgi:hypothetical protein
MLQLIDKKNKMRKIKTTDILGSIIEMPFKAGILEHLQNSYNELFQALLKHVSFLPNNSSTIYVLYGCENTGTAPNYIISAGAVYYQGEIYFVDATTFTAAVGAVAVLETTQYSAVDAGANQKGDPVLFTDLTPRNVLDIRKIQIIDGDNLTAGFINDFANVVYLQSDWVTVGAASAPAFSAGWVAGSAPVQYMMEANGFVNIRGVPIRSSGSGIVIFTLPAGFRPPANINYPVFDATIGAGAMILQVTTLGEVILPSIVTGNTNVIGTIRFRIS